MKNISKAFNGRSLPHGPTTVLPTSKDTEAGLKLSRLDGRTWHRVHRLTDPPTCATLEESDVTERGSLAITNRLILQDVSESNETHTDIRLLAFHSANPPASSRALEGYLISVRLTRPMTFRCAGRPTTRYPLPLSSGPIEGSSRVAPRAESLLSALRWSPRAPKSECLRNFKHRLRCVH